MPKSNVQKKSQDKLVYEVVQNIGIIAEYSNGWTKELNRISWNNQEPKFDLRDWDPDHEHMSRGITLKEDEARVAVELLNSYFAS